MKKILIQFIFTLFCCSFLLLLLFYSAECISLASNGLLIWYKNMIPSLFPFMVLSGFMVRSGLSLKIGQWLQPVLGLFFRLPSQMLYAIFMGFLCGFPMGAKIVSDMLEKEQITLKEGEYLLTFCNNIGPLYMLGYVIPLFGYENIGKILGLMYLIPLGYGLGLRYFSPTFSTLYNSKNSHKNATRFLSFFTINSTARKNISHDLSACSYSKDNSPSPNYLIYFQQSLSSAIEQITMLGGCMVFFNCLLIFPKMLENLFSNTTFWINNSLLNSIFSSLIEIGGGLKLLSLDFTIMNNHPAYLYLPLALLTIGGLSCIVQTYFVTKNTGLKISTYIKHKFIQSCIYILFVVLSL